MVTSLTLYPNSSSASATISTANQLIANATIATNAGVPKTHVDASTGFGEVCSQVQSGAWLGHVGAITDAACNPTGHGWFLDATTLDLQDIISGNWTPAFRHVTSANSYTCDMYCRAWIYNPTGGTYALIGSAMVLSGQTINTTIANFTWAATSLPTASFPAGTKLYIDRWDNILTTTCVSGNTVQVNQSSLAGDGLAAVNIITPGYQPTPAALSGEVDGVGTLAGTVSRSTALTGTLAAVGTLSGTLTVSSGISLSGEVDGVGTLRGTLSVAGGGGLPTDNPYGLTIGLNPGCGNAASNYTHWSQLFADMKSKGMTWLRFQLSWCSIELTQGTYSWGALDDAVSQCNAAGISILYTLRGAPTWALTTTSQKATTEPWFLPDPTLMAGFATAVATRYDGHHGHGHIDAFGFNEDFSIHFTNPAGGWSGVYNNTLYPGLYGTGGAVTSANKWQPARDFHFASPVVLAVTQAIRSTYPGVMIGMPCIWWTQPINVGGLPNTPVSNYTASLQTLYNDLGTGLFDFLDFHYYSNSQAPLVGSNQVSTIGQAMTDLRTVAIANGDANIPIYLTEFGWQVPTDVASYTTQATYYQQVLDAVRAGGANPKGKIFFFTLDYGTTPGESSLVKWNGASYDYEPAWTTWGNYITQYPTWGQPPTGTYTVLINGQAMFVIARTLTSEGSVGRRATASFTVLTDTNTHFAQYQQVSIFDQNAVLAFSGYITIPKKQKPGFQPYLVHAIQCTDQHFLADKRIVAASYTNQTIGFMVADILANYLAAEGVGTGLIIDPGITIASAVFAYCTAAQALDALVKSASSAGIPFYWMIDQNKQLFFVPYTTVIGPSVDGTTVDDGQRSGVLPSATPGNPLYRNTQYLLGGVAQTATQTNIRPGDGNTTAWVMDYPLATVPTVSTSLNGAGYVTKTVGISGVDTGKDFYWSKGSNAITQDSAGTKLRKDPTLDLLKVVYTGQYPTLATDSNAGQISYQKGIDGTSGIIEEVEQDTTLTDLASGLAEVSQLLTRYATQGQIFEFATKQAGYAPGQLITVNYTPFNFANAQMLIESVIASDQQDGLNIWYTVKAVQGPYDTTWTNFFSTLLKQPPPVNSINIGTGQSVLLSASGTLTLSATMTGAASVFACPLPSTSLFPSTTLYPC